MLPLKIKFRLKFFNVGWFSEQLGLESQPGLKNFNLNIILTW